MNYIDAALLSKERHLQRPAKGLIEDIENDFVLRPKRFPSFVAQPVVDLSWNITDQ